MTRNILDCLPEIQSRLGSAASGVLLMLDFDGTISRIADQPEQAVLEPRVRNLLTRLYRLPPVRIAIISGRSLDDIRKRVDLTDIVYAGNHGLEIRGPGVEFVHQGAAQHTHLVEKVLTDLRVRLADVPGIRLENKLLTASIHYRHAEPEHLHHIFEATRQAIDPYRGSLRLAPGLKVINVLPDVHWTKGEAAEWIRDMYRCRDFVPIYMGDDVTDEDAFRQLSHDGITIRVGPCAKTQAAYHVSQPGEAEEFLDWLLTVKSVPAKGAAAD